MSARLGLKGIPAEAEEIMVIRDILLARRTGGHVHLCHMSTRGSVELIRWGKERGINVTAEVCPHHLSLTEDAVEGYDTNAKMNPPLRTADDVAALQRGGDGRHDRPHRDRPRAAPLRREGARVRRRAERHRRARDGARGRRHVARGQPGIIDFRDARRADVVRAGARCSSCRAARSRRERSADVTVFDPTCAWTVDPCDVSLEGAQHAVRGADAARARRVHDRRRARGAPRGRPIE